MTRFAWIRSSLSGSLRQIEEALAVRGHEGADEDQRGDAVGPVGRCLRDDDAAHAVTDEHGGLGPAREHVAAHALAQLSSVTSATGVSSLPPPGRSNASTVWPAASSGPITGSQHQAPPKAPWTRTKRAI